MRRRSTTIADRLVGRSTKADVHLAIDLSENRCSAESQSTHCCDGSVLSSKIEIRPFSVPTIAPEASAVALTWATYPGSPSWLIASIRFGVPFERFPPTPPETVEPLMSRSTNTTGELRVRVPDVRPLRCDPSRVSRSGTSHRSTGILLGHNATHALAASTCIRCVASSVLLGAAGLPPQPTPAISPAITQPASLLMMHRRTPQPRPMDHQGLASPGRLELPTPCLGGRCSIQTELRGRLWSV